MVDSSINLSLKNNDKNWKIYHILNNRWSHFVNDIELISLTLSNISYLCLILINKTRCNDQHDINAPQTFKIEIFKVEGFNSVKKTLGQNETQIEYTGFIVLLLISWNGCKENFRGKIFKDMHKSARLPSF